LITASAFGDECQFLVQCTKTGCGRKYYLEGHCPKHGIQNHLNKGEYGIVDPVNPLRRIPVGEVGCKICEKGINQIYSEERTLYDAKGAEKK